MPPNGRLNRTQLYKTALIAGDVNFTCVHPEIHFKSFLNFGKNWENRDVTSFNLRTNSERNLINHLLKKNFSALKFRQSVKDFSQVDGLDIICRKHSVISGSMNRAGHPTFINRGAIDNDVSIVERDLVRVLGLVVVDGSVAANHASLGPHLNRKRLIKANLEDCEELLLDRLFSFVGFIEIKYIVSCQGVARGPG